VRTFFLKVDMGSRRQVLREQKERRSRDLSRDFQSPPELQPCSLCLLFPSWLCQHEARLKQFPPIELLGELQVEERNLLEDIIEDLERQHQYPDYQYSDQMYDAEPAPPARALHQDDLRAATRQGKQIKSSMLPAYCDPPNPCPLGYTAQDGCIEDFENNSEFSQKYQASQNCMCDTEHMFACPQPKQQNGGLSFLGGFPSAEEVKNPFLAGAKLSIAAKKGMGY